MEQGRREVADPERVEEWEKEAAVAAVVGWAGSEADRAETVSVQAVVTRSHMRSGSRVMRKPVPNAVPP